MDLIPNDWKHSLAPLKLLKNSLEKNTRKVKDFSKLSKQINFTTNLSNLYFIAKLYGMTPYCQCSHDIWRQIFTEWFIKCSDGYIFSI